MFFVLVLSIAVLVLDRIPRYARFASDQSGQHRHQPLQARFAAESRETINIESLVVPNRLGGASRGFRVRAGLEHFAKTTGKVEVFTSGGAKNGAVASSGAHGLHDVDLQAVISIWPRLPDAIKDSVLDPAASPRKAGHAHPALHLRVPRGLASILRPERERGLAGLGASIISACVFGLQNRREMKR